MLFNSQTSLSSSLQDSQPSLIISFTGSISSDLSINSNSSLNSSKVSHSTFNVLV